MQRQSLGSWGRERLSLSVSKDDAVTSSHHLDDHKRRESSPPPSFSDVTIADADEIKPVKPHSKSHSSHHHPHSSFIHLIPALVLFCFLVLYLSSHDPSPQDMAQFHGFTIPDQIIEMKDIGESMNNNNKVLKRSEAFVIRSLRNIQEENIIQRDTRPRSHRKLADF